jgi:Ion channel
VARSQNKEAGTVVNSVASKVAPRRILSRTRPTSQYGALFVMLLLTFVLVGSLPNNKWSLLAVLIIESATLLLALRATGARKLWMAWSLILVGLGLIAGITNVAIGSTSLPKAIAGVSFVLILIAPASLVRAVIIRRTVDIQTVMAALCFYVMLGLFFVFLFSAIQSISGHHFFSQTDRGSQSDFLYFSFATLTTVGYGDLTAAYPPGRTLAVAEAMLGQLYLVTVVAVLVSNLGPMAVRKRTTKSPVGEVLDDVEEVT